MISLPLVTAACLAVGLFLSYLTIDSRCQVLGRDLKRLETDIEDLHRTSLSEESKWLRMKSPVEVEKALTRHHLAMAWPSERQIVRLRSGDVLAALRQSGWEADLQVAQARRTRVHE